MVRALLDAVTALPRFGPRLADMITTKRATPLLAPALAVVPQQEESMNGIIYLVGLVVVVMFVLSFLGLR